MSLTREEALNILTTDTELLSALVENAYKLRTKYKGNRVSIQLLTNVRSGNCTQNCAYCAQSRDSEAPIEKYRYVEDKKLYGDNDLVDEMHLARHCIGLSGIRFADDDIEKLAERIRKMKKNDTQICCSIGFLTEKQALILKEAGLNRINHNLNSSRRFYPSICTTHTYQERIDNLYRRALEWDAAHPVQQLNKATSKQITALGTQMNNAILNMTTAMMGQTQVVQSGQQTQSNSSNMMLIVIVAVVLIIMLIK